MLGSYTKGFTRRHFHDIYNFERLFKHLEKSFPWIPVKVSTPRDLASELADLQNASIVITPCGGISTVLAFLPPGAHIIVMDYFVDKDEGLGQVGESASMESGYWALWGHLEKVFYQVWSGEKEMVWDDPGFEEGYRKKASVVVDMDRIESFIWEILKKTTFTHCVEPSPSPISLQRHPSAHSTRHLMLQHQLSSTDSLVVRDTDAYFHILQHSTTQSLRRVLERQGQQFLDSDFGFLVWAGA